MLLLLPSSSFGAVITQVEIPITSDQTLPVKELSSKKFVICDNCPSTTKLSPIAKTAPVNLSVRFSIPANQEFNKQSFTGRGSSLREFSRERR